jgi:hypothetical protein
MLFEWPVGFAVGLFFCSQCHPGQRLLLLLYMFACTVYFAICIALLVANTLPDDTIDAEYFLPFHMLEFWGQACFTVLEALVLLHSDLVPLFSFPALLIGANIIASLTAAVLFSINGHLFDRTAHWIEYCAQITIVLANFVFVFANWRRPLNTGISEFLYRWRYVECVVVVALLSVSIVQLLVFVPVIHIEAFPVPDQVCVLLQFFVLC